VQKKSVIVASSEGKRIMGGKKILMENKFRTVKEFDHC